MSPCIGLGVPMIPLVSQLRMWDFLDSCGLDNIGIDAFSKIMEQELYDNAMKILADPELRIDRFKHARKMMREAVRKINVRIEKRFFQ